MSARDAGNTYNRVGWESTEFPLLCQTCLGPNPYIRMTRQEHGKECKVCNRPCTVFRWCPGPQARYKQTIICQNCSKLKNVCQTCLFDLEYGLPTQVRDAALGVAQDMPQNEVNREYYLANMAKTLQGSTDSPIEELASEKAQEALKRMARTTPYYKRNRAKICSFWVKGNCNRGDTCPYRHEMPTDPNDPLANQNIHDRYHGVNDPVAKKMMGRLKSKQAALTPPQDQTVKTLYVGGVDGTQVGEQDLRDHFYQFGEIMSIRLATRQSAAFVEFTTRGAAEAAAAGSSNLSLKGKSLKVLWGRSRQAAPGQAKAPTLAAPGLPGPAPMPGAAAAAVSGDPSAIAQATAAAAAALAPPSRAALNSVSYPSMDPQRMGSRAAREAKEKGVH